MDNKNNHKGAGQQGQQNDIPTHDQTHNTDKNKNNSTNTNR